MSKEMQATVKMMNKMLNEMPKSSDFNYPLMREGTDQFFSSMAREDVTIKPETIEGIYTELLTPSVLKNDNIVYYIHGGAFTMGSAISSRGFGTVLADWLGMRVYTISYRLAPENPYPAGKDDCYAVYKVLCERHKDNKIFITGDSAGANFCLVLTQQAIADGIRVPDAIVSNCPVTDVPNLMDNISPKDINVDKKMLTEVFRAYWASTDTKQPGISPYYGSFKGFPFLILTCDADETFRRDAELVYNKCRDEDVDVQLFVFTNTHHAFATSDLGKSPESRMLLDITKHAFV